MILLNHSFVTFSNLKQTDSHFQILNPFPHLGRENAQKFTLLTLM